MAIDFAVLEKALFHSMLVMIFVMFFVMIFVMIFMMIFLSIELPPWSAADDDDAAGAASFRRVLRRTYKLQVAKNSQIESPNLNGKS